MTEIFKEVAKKLLDYDIVLKVEFLGNKGQGLFSSWIRSRCRVGLWINLTIPIGPKAFVRA